MTVDAKDDIKRRLSVEDVVGSYIELKRAGRNFKALSPFNSEKTPSFMVSPDKQIWHDFSAGKGGDIFTFVMEMEGVDFRGAMEILARKAGIDLEKYSKGSGKTAQLKKRLHEANELALRYYHITLSKNQEALKYLKDKRGYSSQIIKDFKLGFSPSSGRALAQFLRKKGFNDTELRQAGLASRRQGYDMFRGRIMVPLMDGQGRPIGFTARLLRDEPNSPKYINTPQTLIYDKGRHVFGLHLAKAAMRERDLAVLVEGNMDVIASHQAGVKYCVATAGTALTRDQLQQLGRLTTNVKLAFDQDRAGLEATERAVALAQDVGVNLSIITLSQGKDPDELIKKDPGAWEQAIDDSVYVLDWLVEHYAKAHKLDTAQGKRAYSDELARVIANIKDPVEAGHYIGIVAERTGVSEDRIKQKIDQAGQLSQVRPARLMRATAPANQGSEPAFTYVDTFLGLMVKYPDTRTALSKVEASAFGGDHQNALFGELYQNPNIDSQALKTDEDYVKIVTFRAEELYGSRSSSERLADAMELARRIAKETLKQRKDKISEAIRLAEDAGDAKKAGKLLKKYHGLIKED